MNKRIRLKRYHEFGCANEVMLAEERVLIAGVQKTLSSSGNAANIGRAGENGVREFLERYLPYVFRAESGHFVTPRGHRSPEIDIMLLDSRYPLLAHAADGSVLAMAHSVVTAIQVKTAVQRREIVDFWNWAEEVGAASKEVFPLRNWSSVSIQGLGFAARLSDATTQKHFFELGATRSKDAALRVLRAKPQQEAGPPEGALMWFEDGEHPQFLRTVSPLSDFFYEMVQGGHYTLGSRGFDGTLIGQHMLGYYSLGTTPEHWGSGK